LTDGPTARETNFRTLRWVALAMALLSFILLPFALFATATETIVLAVLADTGHAPLVALLAIAICRPVPVAAEASIILAGISGAARGRLMSVSILSNLGISLVYATAGALAWNSQSFFYALLAAIFFPVVCLCLYRLQSWLTR